MPELDAPARPHVTLMGVGFDAVTEQDVIDRVLADPGGGQIATVNLDILRQCAASAEVKALVDACTLVVADGAPIVWAASLAGRPVPERVAGSSLVRTLTAAAAGRAPVYFLGGNPGAADAAAARMREEAPGLEIASSSPPMGFESNPAEMERIEGDLRAAAPRIVFVGLGFPKQERLIERLRPLFPEAWFVSCGISFSFVSGEVSRAPRLLQRLGLEWMHRLGQEPRRLAGRYLVHDPPFLIRLMVDAVRRRAA